MDRTDSEIIHAVLNGETELFEELIVRYQPRVFGTARRYARREDEIEDIVQEVFLKSYQKLSTFRGDAPFEHWLMRLAVRTCYDFLRSHQRNRETPLADLTDEEGDWLERFAVGPDGSKNDDSAATQTLLNRILERLPADARMVITLLEIEERSMKEVAELTGWSVAKVKVRAFRARNQMRKVLSHMARDKFL